MDAIFIANGKSFKPNNPNTTPHTTVKNLQIYNIICRILYIKCADNNGTSVDFLNAPELRGKETSMSGNIDAGGLEDVVVPG
jgi:hypothetical protein